MQNNQFNKLQSNKKCIKYLFSVRRPSVFIFYIFFQVITQVVPFEQHTKNYLRCTLVILFFLFWFELKV